MKRKIAMLLALVMVFALCGCGSKLTGIYLNNNSIELEIDETATLTYTLVPENASNKDIKWQSSNTNVAVVDENGIVSAVTSGSATIICSSASGISATCEVVVQEPSAVSQLNEYESWLFSVLIEKVFPNFYNSSAARIKKLGPTINEDYADNMILDIEIQGVNKVGGTIYKDYCVMCTKDISKSTYLAAQTDNGLFKAPPHEWKENTIIDIAKINLALEEYWAGKGM